MCTPVGRVTRQCCPKRLPQSEPALAVGTHAINANAANTTLVVTRFPPRSPLGAARAPLGVARSMLSGDGGGVHYSGSVAPAGSYIGAQSRNLFVVQADAEFETAHLGPRAIGERRLMRAVQDDIDESCRIGRLQGRTAGQRRRCLRRVGVCRSGHSQSAR